MGPTPPDDLIHTPTGTLSVNAQCQHLLASGVGHCCDSGELLG